MDKKKWRAGSAKTFTARPIKKIEYPILVKALKDDGLHAGITVNIKSSEGICVNCGEYPFTK